jgi:hypothetical protein
MCVFFADALALVLATGGDVAQFKAITGCENVTAPERR